MLRLSTAINRCALAMKASTLTLALCIMPSFALAELSPNILPDYAGGSIKIRQSPFVGGNNNVSVGFNSLDESGFNISGPNFSVWKNDKQRVYVGLGTDELSHERDDSDALSDMPELDRAINGRIGAAWKNDDSVLSLDLAHDLAGAHNAPQAKLRYTLSSDLEQTHISPFAELQWLSADFNDYYVGVNPQNNRSSRPNYQADSDFAIKAGANIEHPLGKKLTLTGGIEITHYGDEITESPVVDKDTLFGGHIGITYRWK